jgi:hypothetical protein
MPQLMRREPPPHASPDGADVLAGVGALRALLPEYAP